MIIFSVQYTLFERVNLTLMVARSSPIFSFDFAVLLYCVDRPRDVNHAHLYSLQERTRQKTIESARYLHTYITTITTTTTTITAYTAAFPQSRSSSAGIRVISASDIGNAGGWCTVNRSPEHPHSADFVLIYGWSFSKKIVKPFFFFTHKFSFSYWMRYAFIFVLLDFTFYTALLLVLLLSGRRNPGNIVWFSFSSSRGSTSRYCTANYSGTCGILRLEKVHCFLFIGRCQVRWISAAVQPKIRLRQKAKIGRKICRIL